MAALHRCKWPELKTLLMKDCNLDCHSIEYLTAASWPHLEHLQLLGNWLLPMFSCILCRGDWPRLSKLDLCGVFSGSISDHVTYHDEDRGMNPQFMQCLDTANWPATTQIRLRKSMLELTSVELLVTGQWSAMQDLDLSEQHFSTSMFAVLGQAQWPELHTLSVEHTWLDKDGTSELVKGTWPKLQCLDVSHNYECHTYSGTWVGFGASAIAVLSKGHWPLLERLNMHGNYVDEASMSSLVQGNWPLLKVLDVSCQGLDTAAVQVLMCTQSFPLLQYLEMPVEVVGDLHEAQQVDQRFYREPRNLNLCLGGSSASVSQWHSNLREVCVSSAKATQMNGHGEWFRTWDIDRDQHCRGMRGDAFWPSTLPW